MTREPCSERPHWRERFEELGFRFHSLDGRYWDERACFAFTADGLGVHAEREFTVAPTLDGRGTLIVSHETQVGWLPRLGRAIVGPRLHAANQRFFADLAQAARGPALA